MHEHGIVGRVSIIASRGLAGGKGMLHFVLIAVSLEGYK
jgi:hypothetical protein